MARLWRVVSLWDLPELLRIPVHLMASSPYKVHYTIHTWCQKIWIFGFGSVHNTSDKISWMAYIFLCIFLWLMVIFYRKWMYASTSKSHLPMLTETWAHGDGPYLEDVAAPFDSCWPIHFVTICFTFNLDNLCTSPALCNYRGCLAVSLSNCWNETVCNSTSTFPFVVLKWWYYCLLDTHCDIFYCP